MEDEDVISCATGVTVKQGDTVTVMLVDGVPTVIASSSSEQTSTEAAETAQRVEAHFWHDDEGAHVSEADKSVEGNNILIDTDSVDIRNGTDVLATFTPDGVLVNPNAKDGELMSSFGKGEFRLSYKGLDRDIYSSPGQIVIRTAGGFVTGYSSSGVRFGLQPGCQISWSNFGSEDGKLVRSMNFYSEMYQVGHPEEFCKAINARDLVPQSAPESNDLNACTTPGTYAVASGANWSAMTNAPSFAGATESAKTLIVSKPNGNVIQQQAVDSITGRTYTRRLYNNSWTDWAVSSGDDSIVAEGTSGSWYYQKYGNGLCVCHMYETRSVTIAAGSTSTMAYALSLPFAVTKVCASLACISNRYIAGSFSANASTAATTLNVAIRHAQGAAVSNQSYGISYTVTGFWK